MENKLKLTVGQEVVRSQGYFSQNQHIGTVTKVTPTGRTTVKYSFGEEVYNPDGRIRGSQSYAPTSIKLATEEAKNKVLRRKRFDELRMFFGNDKNVDKLRLLDLDNLYRDLQDALKANAEANLFY